MKRYDRTKLLNSGRFYGTSSISANLRAATVTRSIMTKPQVLQEGERLDHIAAKEFGDSSLWWVIAGCSGIGWSLQVPPGTLLLIPTDLNQVVPLL